MNVFTYGSLMFPEVWRRVTGGAAEGRPARLEGYEARALHGQSYPALVTAPGSVTEGVVYLDVDAAALARLDAFEGGFYIRREVTVNTAEEDGIPAGVYAAAREDHPDIRLDLWRAEEFRSRHLAGFLRSDPGFSGPR